MVADGHLAWHQAGLVAPVLAGAIACLLAGCGGKDGEGAADGRSDGAIPATVGAHALVFQRIGGGKAALATPALATRAGGSTILVSVGRGDASAFRLPTDNKGNAPYVQLGTQHPYTRWPSSGTALYAFAGAAGGPGHVVSVSTPPADEVTVSVVEVQGTQVVDFDWAEVQAGDPLTSPKVTTTGPATLVAFWWGDADVQGDKTAVPGGGFVVIDAVLLSGALVQSAVAVKQVDAAGSYDVTWASTPTQGAQLWIAAVQ